MSAALSSLFVALKIVGVIFVAIVVVGAWLFTQDLADSLTGRGG